MLIMRILEIVKRVLGIYTAILPDNRDHQKYEFPYGKFLFLRDNDLTPLFPLNCYSLADWPRSRNITRIKSLFMYHYVAHK